VAEKNEYEFTPEEGLAFLGSAIISLEAQIDQLDESMRKYLYEARRMYFLLCEAQIKGGKNDAE
jgi:hypothetical protein